MGGLAGAASDPGGYAGSKQPVCAVGASCKYPKNNMPRLDAPGVFHHVIGRRIEGTKIFRKVEDRNDFVNRLAKIKKS